MEKSAKEIDREKLMNELRSEGFSHVYVWSDGPKVYYPPHQHPRVTAHIILAGGMEVMSEGRTKHYTVGERFDVVANKIHSARMGNRGCTYIIGE